MTTLGKWRPTFSSGITVALLVLFGFCKEPFDAESNFQGGNFLVVEGYINIGFGITEIKLSRTGPLSEPEVLNIEPGALVKIESGNGDEYPLHELNNGRYVSDSIDLPFEDTYRISIQTTNGELFTSEFVTPIRTPKIDSINWEQDFNGVTIYISTHDPENEVLYYQWEYDEVWEKLSNYKSFVKYIEPDFIPRTEEETEMMYRCWKYASNPEIIVSSTEALSQNSIPLKPLIVIPAYIEKLGIRYSVLVKQHALSADAYQFFKIMEKNNNNLGTFFDAQPSQLFGNIRSESSDKPVIGFIDAYTTESQRIEIVNDRSLNWQYFQPCEELQIANDSLAVYLQFNIPTIIWTEGADEDFRILGTYAAPTLCVDCRIGGGRNVKPPFW
jgi:Domain of unknown function (DUF4249)